MRLNHLTERSIEQLTRFLLITLKRSHGKRYTVIMRRLLTSLARRDGFNVIIITRAWNDNHCGTLSRSGAACRDGNNATIDPAVCLAKLMSEYRRLELVRQCRAPCPSDGENSINGCPPAALASLVWAPRSECPRNCLGTRGVRGMFRAAFSLHVGVSLIPFDFMRRQTRRIATMPTQRTARARG